MRVRVFAFAAALVCACTVGACSSQPAPHAEHAATPADTSPPPAPAPEPPPGPPPEQLATKLPAAAIRESLPALPIEPSPRPRDYVVAAYEFAALHPEVLKYVPCYCGCERSGHQHNESCFITERDAEGRVVRWNGHGMG